MKTLALGTLSALALAAAVAPALAGPDTRTFAEATFGSLEDHKPVPLCNVRMEAGFFPLGSDTFRLAAVDRLCMTGHDVRLDHEAGFASRGATVMLGGHSVRLDGGSVTLVAGAAPGDMRDDLVIRGVDAQTARMVADTLQISVRARSRLGAAE